MKKVLIAGAMGACVVMAGCGGSAKIKQAPAHVKTSEALQFALRAGLTRYDGALRDVEVGDVALHDARGTKASRTGGKVIDGAGGAALLATGAVATGGLFLGNLLFSSSGRDHPATDTHVIAWMPRDMARNKREAKTLMQSILREAIVSSMPDGYAIERVTLPKWGKPETLDVVTGPGCEAPTICRLFIILNNPEKVDRGYGSTANMPAWEWRNHDVGSDSSDRRRGIGVYARKVDSEGLQAIMGAAGETPVTKRDLARAVATAAPEWVYGYLGPTEEHPEPVVVHQGRILRFIAPGV